MSARNLLLAVLLSAVILFAAAWAAGAKTPVNGDEPIVMTKAMYADLLCVAASDFDSQTGGCQFSYDPTTNLMKATFLPATQGYSARADATRRALARERAEVQMQRILPYVYRHISKDATSSLAF
jgi:hypothetical protein